MIFWAMLDSGASTADNFEELIKEFKKEYPKIPVKLNIITRRDMWKSIFLFKRFLRPEKYPDIIEIPHYWTSLLSNAGIIENLSKLDPKINSKGFIKPVSKHCYKPGTKDIYSMPWWMDIMALHYRADHLEQVSKNPAKELQTWKGLIRICKKLKKKFKNVKGYSPIQNTDWRGSVSVRSLFPCIWSRGAGVFNKKWDKSLVGTDQFKKAITDFLQLALDGYLPVLKERGSLGTMTSGKASIMITRRQVTSMFETKQKNFKVKTIEFPLCGKEKQTYLSGINLAMMSDAKEKKDAMIFLKWITNPKNQKKYAKLIEAFPTNKKAFNDFIKNSPKRVGIYKKIISNARVLPNIQVCGTAVEILNKILADTVEDIARGKYKEENLIKSLDWAAKEIDYLLSLYKN